ncbi:hypothetical protein [Brucella anthropi]|uniref:hypothetical protein n=1 Tax=Brucella anthropi TaxID=529 RepID=UPI00124D5DF4|nr:hypothetical protein [Brucella anthropi]KAB2724159.1 hypothetical protein F9K76_20335 [Brucella anthropi]
MSDAVNLAYLAGVIDSDGTIGIKRDTYNMRIVGDCSQPIYNERICVKQVERSAIDLLHHTFGGTFYTCSASVRRGKPLFVWQVTDKKAVSALCALLPFLRIKKSQAENCLDLRTIKDRSKVERVAKNRGHMGSKPRSATLSAAMEGCYQRARHLNKVGVS